MEFAGESGMARPQRGTHRFREEPVPRNFLATRDDTPLPAISSSRSLALRAHPRFDSCRSRACRPILGCAGTGRSCPLTSTRPGSDQPRRGRFMGPEIETPVTSRVAPHRQYVPLPIARAARLPASTTSVGALCRASPRPAAASSCPSCGRWCISGCCWPSSRSSGSRAAPSWPLATLALGALPVHYLAPTAGRSRCSWRSRSPGWSGSSAADGARSCWAWPPS